MNPSNKIQRILIAIDFSDNARAAFYTALDLAKRFEAQTWVLHVSEPIRSFDFGKKKYVETKEAIERVEAGVNKRIDDLWAAGGEQAIDRRKVHMIVRGGPAHQEIIDTAIAKEVDLIVLGAKGASDTTALIGGTAERVLRNAPCSVHCVRARE